MLVVTRKPGEAIRIGKEIIVVVKRVKGDRVRVAIEAPAETRITRGELEVRDAN